MIVKEKGLWALTTLGLVFFWRPLLLGETFFFRDIYLYYAPIKQILLEVLRAGEPPFWNPFLHGGQPLLADISSTPFYPSLLLYLVLSVPRALTLDIVLHVLASAAALYALARRLDLSQPSAALAGAAFGYCGYTLSQANLYFRLLATPYLPLMLLCWHAYLHRPRRRSLAGLLALGLLQVFAGSGEMVAFTWLTLLGWALCHPATGSIVRKARIWLLSGLVVVGLAAPQIVPLIEMVGQSQRGEGMSAESFSYWSVDPRRLPELAVPGFMGRTDTFTPEDYWGGGIVDSGFPYMLSLYLGALVLALALLGATHRQAGALPHGLRRLLLFLAMLALVLALGRFLPFFDFLYRVPGASLFRFPVKILTIGILPMALLAAEGVEALLRADGQRLKRLLVLAWTIAGATGLLLAIWSLVPAFSESVQLFFFDQADARIEQGLRQGWLRLAAVWLAATLAIQLHTLRPRAWLPWALAGLVAVDLMQVGQQVNPTVPAGLLSERPPVANLVAEHLGDGRFYRHPVSDEILLSAPSSEIQWLYRWNQEVLRFYLAASYRIPVIFHLDFHGLAASRVMRLKETLESVPWDRRLQLLSAGAVTVFVTEDQVRLPSVEKIGTLKSSNRPFHVYRNHRAAGRAQLVRAYRRVASETEARDAMLAEGFDPRQHAVVEGEVPDPDLECRGPGRARVHEARSHRRRISVTSDCPGLLVLAEVHYPGWRVRVDGEDAPVLRANAAFSAVWLEAGEHEVEWHYVPRAFYLGLLLAGLTAGGLLVGLRRARLAIPRASTR